MGPFWDHVDGYREASLERPEKVMFVKYEEMKREPLDGVKRLAEFCGCPFTMEEIMGGVSDEILEMCSFEKLSNLEANKEGSTRMWFAVENRAFFRRGKVGDWKNCPTPDMGNKIDEITRQKLCGLI